MRLLLFALRYAREGSEILEKLPQVIYVIDELLRNVNGKVAVDIFLLYVKKVANVSEAEVQKKLQSIIDSRLDPDLVAAFAVYDLVKKATREGELIGVSKGLREGKLEGQREGKLEGKLEGKREGRREGKREGKRSVLQRLLVQRFGLLSREALAKLEAATSRQLDAMTLRVLAAKRLEDVFDES